MIFFLCFISDTLCFVPENIQRSFSECSLDTRTPVFMFSSSMSLHSIQDELSLENDNIFMRHMVYKLTSSAARSLSLKIIEHADVDDFVVHLTLRNPYTNVPMLITASPVMSISNLTIDGQFSQTTPWNVIIIILKIHFFICLCH